jgi:hypothetical protein
VTWKTADSAVGARFTFLGVHFDHSIHAVQLGPKILAKLQQQRITSASSMSEVESAIGRLMHASAVMKVNLAKYYYTFKLVRRRMSLLNRGRLSRADQCSLPESAVKELEEWTEACRSSKPRIISRCPPTSHRYVLFTDSTMEGWGAVFVDTHLALVRVAGGRWTSRPPNINAAELRGSWAPKTSTA